MMHNKFSHKEMPGNMPKYLKYDDIFMSKTGATRQINTPQKQNRESFQQKEQSLRDYDEEEIDYLNEEEQYEDEDNENSYFSGNTGIIDERMIKYQKRKLPPLQRYSEQTRKGAIYSRAPAPYWADDEYRQRKYNTKSIFANVWQKFFITFTSILSLICLSWIAYNWGNDRVSIQPTIIEPENDKFKVLPEEPGGEFIPHKDKAVYEKVNPNIAHSNNEEKLLPPEESPLIVEQNNAKNQNNVEEYSIVDEKIYYIKISYGKSKEILENEVKLLRKKFAGVIGSKECSVKKVSNNSGEKKYAILVGSFESQEVAAYIARELGGNCSIISVKE
ncbi:hypothetical protein FACS1894113_4080 [Alphaproteobacteria bacterium]|nr:hypothetical protein FACS1894113_4080 [Alphaproteobacteria bacterium]